MDIKVFYINGDIRHIRPTFLGPEYGPDGAQFAEDRVVLSDIEGGVRLVRKYYKATDGLLADMQEDGGSVLIVAPTEYADVSSIEVDDETVLESDGNGGLVRNADTAEDFQDAPEEGWDEGEDYAC